MMFCVKSDFRRHLLGLAMPQKCWHVFEEQEKKLPSSKRRRLRAAATRNRQWRETRTRKGETVDQPEHTNNCKKEFDDQIPSAQEETLESTSQEYNDNHDACFKTSRVELGRESFDDDGENDRAYAKNSYNLRENCLHYLGSLSLELTAKWMVYAVEGRVIETWILAPQTMKENASTLVRS